MKILKLLNKNYLSIIFILLVALESFAEHEPADIWNINEKKSKDQKEINILTDENENSSLSSTGNSIYKMQSQYQSDTITFDENLGSQEIKLVGLYDPEDFGLDIDMWKNSDGNKILDLYRKIQKIDLSNDS